MECPGLKDESCKESISESCAEILGGTAIKKPLHLQDEILLLSSKTTSSPWSLTLSAFRKDSVRLVDSNQSRKIAEFYEYLPRQTLGHGAMSLSVRLAVRKSDGLWVAVKSVLKSDILRQRKRNNSIKEWEALRMLRDNTNVVDLIDVFETEDEIQMVLEYCAGGELFRSIQEKLHDSSPYHYDETKAANLMQQMMKGLEGLHDRGIIHSDIKPENILLNEDGSEIKLCDFGIACQEEEGYASDYSNISTSSSSSNRSPRPRRQGTNLYAAPELDQASTATTASDVYSLGVTLYVLLHGFPPVFQSDDIDDDLSVAFPSSAISDDAKSLIRSMLQTNPASRITAREGLTSAWIQEHCCTTSRVRKHYFSANIRSVRRRLSISEVSCTNNTIISCSN